MQVSEFDYELPERLIAQHSAEPRESAKLLILDRSKDSFQHLHISDFPDQLGAGDVLVVNASKVFNARLRGRVGTAKAQLLLIRPEGSYWRAIGKPGKKLQPDAKMEIAKGFSATVIKKEDDGGLLVDFSLPPAQVIELANIYGEIPIPPYIKKLPQWREDYQTVYAKQEGSVAAPTAGFHLTEELIKQIKDKGVEIVEVILHVGLGTFMPIRSDALESHQMHAEWVEISEATASTIMKAKYEHRRVIAIGTTTTRALEGVAEASGGTLRAWQGEINIFITPGFGFKVIDGLLTNFHLPKSTLLVLISAFAGKEKILKAYKEAVEKEYRFYSFGDAMLIV